MAEGFTQLSAEDLGGGDALSQLNEQLKLAIANILDINKDPTATRTVTLKIKFVPVKGKERQEYAIEYQADAKLPPDAPGHDDLFLAKGKGYTPVARQMSFEEAFDPETGEVYENAPAETEGVTKLQPASNAEGGDK